MPLLGTVVEQDKHFTAQVDYRLVKANAALWKHSNVLTASEITLRMRFQKFSEVMQSMVLYCTGGWVWSHQLYL